MTAFENLLLDNKHLKLDLDFILQQNIDEVLDYCFTLKTLDNFLKEKKEEITSEILMFFKNVSKYKHADTNEDINSTYLLEFYFNKPIPNLKIHLKKLSTEELENFWNYLFNQNNFNNE